MPIPRMSNTSRPIANHRGERAVGFSCSGMSPAPAASRSEVGTTTDTGHGAPSQGAVGRAVGWAHGGPSSGHIRGSNQSPGFSCPVSGEQGTRVTGERRAVAGLEIVCPIPCRLADP